MQMRRGAPFAVDLSHSVHHEWVVKGNQIIEGDCCMYPSVARFLTESEVQHLVEVWFTEAHMAWTVDDEVFTFPQEHVDLMTSISSLDFTLREVIEDIRSLNDHNTMTRRPINPRNEFLRLRVVNTTNADQSGLHWFTLAYTFEPNIEL